MSTDAHLGDGSLGTAEAYAAIEAYARECGRVPLLLLLHVAVPQSFRPDLLNLIKANFVPEAEADLSVDADVLFSPLVEPLGGGFHRLDAEVRRQCLLLLDAMHKNDGLERRSMSVARFLLAYADDRERRPGVAEDWLLLEYLAVQRWVARAFLDPAEAAERFAAALAEVPTEGKAATRLQLGSVASALSVPLAGHPELIAYARGLEALKGGDANEARRQLGLLGGEQITVGGVVLRPAAELLRGNGAMRQAAPPSERSAPADEARYGLRINLPPPPARFVGRRAELQEAREALLQERPPSQPYQVAIRGPDGIGKWMLARQLVHDPKIQARYPDGIVWLDEGGGGYPRDALRQWADARGIPGLLDDGALVDREVAGAAFAGRSVLVVADARCAADILPTLAQVIVSPSALLSLTEQPRTEAQYTIILPSLSRSDTYELLHSIVGLSQDSKSGSDPFNELLQPAYAGNPLIVQLLAGLILAHASLPQHELTERWSGGSDGVKPLVLALAKQMTESQREALLQVCFMAGRRTVLSKAELGSAEASDVVNVAAGWQLLEDFGDSIRIHPAVSNALGQMAEQLAAEQRGDNRRSSQQVGPSIYLSYARLDNEVPTLDREAKGWVRYLYDLLHLALRQRLGVDVLFWQVPDDLDDSLYKQELDALDHALDLAEILIAIVSPGYLKSKWCAYELERFLARHRDPAGPAAGERVIKVLKHRMDEASLPPVFQKRVGYRFFALDPDSKREVPFYLNGKMRREAEYLDVVERLVEYLVERLEDTPKPVVAPTARPTRTVFLALPQGADVSEPALRVRIELQAAKLAVSEPPTTPTTEAEARAVVREVLSRTDSAVHIVGRSAGALLRDGQVPAVHLQLEESGRWADERPGFRRYILLLATYKEGNAAHQAFVGRLQQDLAEGGLLRPDDNLIIEQPGGMTVQEFIQVVLDGLTP